MTAEHIHLLRQTWAQLVPIGDQAATLFYERLFEIDPDTRALFRSTDLAAQRGKLLHALGNVIDGLDRPEQLLPMLERLGRRHAGYGVRDAHYDSVGAALLWTLAQGLGTAWTPAVKVAWRDAYALIAGVMRHATVDLSAGHGGGAGGRQ